jgi:hypothetical protein
VAGYRVTVRVGAKVVHDRAGDLDSALSSLEQHARSLERDAGAPPVGGTLIRRFEPVQRVVGRVEVAGPGRLRAGVDVRGDGSAEAFTGRIRRTLVTQEPGESPYEALRRKLVAL